MRLGKIVSQLLVSCQQKSACQDRAQLGGVLPKRRSGSETECAPGSAGVRREWVVVRQPAGGTPALQEAEEWRQLAAHPDQAGLFCVLAFDGGGYAFFAE